MVFHLMFQQGGSELSLNHPEFREELAKKSLRFEFAGLMLYR
jgi:hypothetical protein